MNTSMFRRGARILAAASLAATVGGNVVVAQNNAPNAPSFPKVYVVPFVIEPQTLSSARARSDQDAFLQELSRHATEQAERVLTSKRLAASIEHVSARPTGKDQVSLTGVIRMPVSLPYDRFGFPPVNSRGRFATAVVTFWIGEKPFARQQIDMTWADGWWTAGFRRHYLRRLDDVLREYAEKSADRAVQGLARDRAAVEMMAQCDHPLSAQEQ